MQGCHSVSKILAVYFSVPGEQSTASILLPTITGPMQRGAALAVHDSNLETLIQVIELSVSKGLPSGGASHPGQRYVAL